MTRPKGGTAAKAKHKAAARPKAGGKADQNDPASAPRAGEKAAGEERPKFSEAAQDESGKAASPDARQAGKLDTRTAGERAAGVPARPLPLPGRIADLPAVGTVATSIPHADGTRGRYAAPPAPGDADDDFDVKELDDLATEFLKDPANRAGTPHDQGVAAYEHAKAVVRARRAGRKYVEEQDESKKKREVSKEEQDAKAAAQERREAVYKGLDFAANPRAYAADPTNAGDQGPKEPVPIDWRAIQDEEGRLRGNLPAAA